jgi:hypothetical protein
MGSALQWVFYAAAFFFYILFLMGSERLWQRCVAAGVDENESWPALWRAYRRHYPQSRLRTGIVVRVAMVFLFAASAMVAGRGQEMHTRPASSGVAGEVRGGLGLGGRAGLMALADGMRGAGARVEVRGLLQQACETLHF